VDFFVADRLDNLGRGVSYFGLLVWVHERSYIKT
jgi:hypothetical protein